VQAYCLMVNHSHPVVETPQPNHVAGRKWLLCETCTVADSKSRLPVEGESGRGRCDPFGAAKKARSAFTHSWLLHEGRLTLLAPAEEALTSQLRPQPPKKFK
jgi:hypothetical protein